MDAAEDLQGEGAGDQAYPEQLLGAEQGEGRQSCHGAGAVHERYPLLEAQHHRSDRELGKERGRIVQLALIVRLPLADDREGEVRQVDQVARGTDAAAFGDIGGDAAVNHILHEL